MPPRVTIAVFMKVAGCRQFDRHPGRLELAGQAEGKRGQRELGPAVGVGSVVPVLEPGIGGVERDLTERAHVDDPGRCRCGQQRHQQPGEKHRREIVDGEPELVAVRTHLPSLARRAEADPRVVHQHVKPRHLRADPGRKVPYLAERGQVGDIAPRAAAELRSKVATRAGSRPWASTCQPDPASSLAR